MDIYNKNLTLSDSERIDLDCHKSILVEAFSPSQATLVLMLEKEGVDGFESAEMQLDGKNRHDLIFSGDLNGLTFYAKQYKEIDAELSIKVSNFNPRGS